MSRRLLAWLWLSAFSIAALAQPRWEPIVDPYSQVFPALIIATATMPLSDEDADPTVLGDPNGFIGVRITASRAREVVDVTVRAPNLMADTTEQFVLAKAGTSYELYPTLRWNFDRLRAQRQPQPDSLNFELRANGQPIGSRTERVRVRSVNDVPYYIETGEGDDEVLDFNWLFAAYVNEDHPIVDEILSEALATEIVESFDGYQSGDEDQVYAQVFAVWHVLQQRGIRYSSITRTANEMEGIHSQHVRRIDESINLKQANCADGSVLFASILRKIDIAPFLVMVPGHMFVGFYLDEAQEQPVYLETTLLGSVTAPRATRVRRPVPAVRAIDADKSWASFEEALSSGSEQVDEAGDAFDSDDPEYQFIDIQAARESGVAPIGS
jgi:hypothetical protein